MHFKGKIFSCDFPGCNEMFKETSKLHLHSMVHLKNEASFFCSFCDRKYLRRTALKKHLRLTHPEEDRVGGGIKY
jgi:hypothetical protein